MKHYVEALKAKINAGPTTQSIDTRQSRNAALRRNRGWFVGTTQISEAYPVVTDEHGKDITARPARRAHAAEAKRQAWRDAEFTRWFTRSQRQSGQLRTEPSSKAVARAQGLTEYAPR